MTELPLPHTLPRSGGAKRVKLTQYTASLLQQADATNIPDRGIPSRLWSTNPNGVVIYLVR